MAKSLREPPPSSSIARLLDKDAAARAVAPPMAESSTREPTTVSPVTHVSPQPRESAYIKREVVLTPSTAETFDRLLELYRRATGTRLNASQVTRAMLQGAAHSMESLEHHAELIGPMRLPSNARGREIDRERFERRLAAAFVAGIRAASALDDV